MSAPCSTASKLGSIVCKPGLAVLAAWTLVATTGCHVFDTYDPSMEQPVPPLAEPAREKALASLPAYRIAPPDVLEIEVLKLVPLPPYRVEVFDALRVQAVGTLLDQPIYEDYLVDGEGTVDLGPAYGKVRVLGMSIAEAEKAIFDHLSNILANPVVAVQLTRSAGTQPITGQYLVGPDGTVNLRQYGAVHIAGKTLEGSRLAMEKHLSQYFDSPDVSLNVAAYNSKVYYVITEGGNLGDKVVRVAITGKETVLDAISNIGGISQISSKEIWIARPVPGGGGCEQILPIDWDSITRGAMSDTNYQIMPGDRVFIAEDGVVALTNMITILTTPFERMAGAASLGTTTIRNFSTMGRAYNRNRQTR